MKFKMLGMALLSLSFGGVFMLSCQEAEVEAQALKVKPENIEQKQNQRVRHEEVKTLSAEDFGIEKYAFRATPTKDEVVLFRVVEKLPEGSKITAVHQDFITFSPDKEVKERVILFSPVDFVVDGEDSLKQELRYSKTKSALISPYFGMQSFWPDGTNVGKELIKDSDYFAEEIFQSAQELSYGAFIVSNRGMGEKPSPLGEDFEYACGDGKIPQEFTQCI